MPAFSNKGKRGLFCARIGEEDRVDLKDEEDTAFNFFSVNKSTGSTASA